MTSNSDNAALLKTIEKLEIIFLLKFKNFVMVHVIEEVTLLGNCMFILFNGCAYSFYPPPIREGGF